MKKKYQIPESIEVGLKTTEILATSPSIVKVDNSTEVDASSSFSGKQRGEWGNIWE